MSASILQLLPPLALLTACGAGTEQPAAPDDAPEALAAVWTAVQPEGLLDLAERPEDIVPMGLTCPVIDVVDGVETWTGDCALLDGTVIEGSLQRFSGPDLSWVEGDRFIVWQGSDALLALDGAIEATHDGDLLHLDAAATTCGASTDCADGPVSLDLRFTLLPGDAELRVYDAAVRGVVALDGADPAPVEGAWRVDRDACELEPLDGIFAAQLDQRHTVELDGGSACDACANRTVQGVDAPAWCDAGT